MTDKAPITVFTFTLDDLFRDRYKLASYQRDFTWTRSELRALVQDLSRRFMSQWRDGHEQSDVEAYEPYYLGSIVYYKESDGFRHLVDGQQRMTTLHLLLIFLRQLLSEQGLTDLAATVHGLIKDPRGKIFRLHIQERDAPLRAIMEGRRPGLSDDMPPSVRNLVGRYAEIEDEFPQDLRYDLLEHFVEWLLWRVCVVGIEAENKAHGWEIFETTNDRGVKLGPMDLLKSHLIGQATKKQQKTLGDKWQREMAQFAEIENHAPTQFMRDLIIARYLDDLGQESIRNATAAIPVWVRDNHHRLGLRSPGDFQEFVENVVLGFSPHYQALLAATRSYHTEHDWARVTYVNQHNKIPYHLAAVLAALRRDDDLETFHEKARLVGNFLDLLYVRRLVNRKAMQAERLDREVGELIGRLRTCDGIPAIRELLGERTAAIRETFAGVARFGLVPESRGQVRYLLARMTSFVQTGVHRPDELAAYLDGSGRYDIEHIVPGSFAQFRSENPSDKLDERQFEVWRNRLGALLLLPKPDNSAIGDLPNPERITHYRRQHMLAATLHPDTRQRYPELKSFIQANKLDKLLRPFPTSFGQAGIKTRQELYQRLCELIWDPAVLGLTVPEPVEPPEAEPDVTGADVPAPVVVSTPNTAALRRMVATGLLRTDEDIVGPVDGVQYRARVRRDGCVEVQGEVFPDLTAAGNFVRRRATRGWEFWQVERNGTWIKIGRLRKR